MAMANEEVSEYKDISKIMDLAPRTLIAIMNNVQFPTTQQGIDICRQFGFSANWLFLGKGETYLKQQATLDKILSILQSK